MSIARAAHCLASAIRHRLSPRVFSSLPSLSLFLPQTLFLLPAMASENFSMVHADDEKNGFSRPEMYKENLAGTVGAYDRHVFVCYKNHEVWPPRVEASDSDPFPKQLATAVKARKNDITIKTKITICEARKGTEFSDGDVLIFPEMIKYRGLNESNIDSFVEDVMVNGKPWAAGVQDMLSGSHVFVCAHGSRDVRCGVCGPVLLEKLNEEIELRGLKDQIFVRACSHIGGHKYAGNLIIYSPGPDGKLMGHWYGYVTPNDVPELLDQHIAKGEVIQRLWRGQMGPSVEEGKGTDAQKLPNGVDTSLSNNENLGGCCQGVNGVSCCRNASSEQSNGTAETAEANIKQGCKLSWPWSVKLNERHILTGVAICGAVVAVSVAYKFYKRSG